MLIDDRWQAVSEKATTSNNAEIWRVEDTRGEFPGVLALKLLRRIDRRDRFEQEARALATLAKVDSPNPNIIRLLAHRIPDEDTNDRPYLVMPWLNGGDARQRAIHQKAFAGNINITISILLPIIRAVNWLHNQQLAESGYIAHRDIKPANILFSDNDTPVLTDFGCAFFDERLTETGESIGSVGYAAPELINGRYEGDLRPADIYSLGAVFYAFLAGSDAPVKGDIIDPKFNLASYITDDRILKVNQIIKSCMNTDPSRRPSAEQLMRDLELLLEPFASVKSQRRRPQSQDIAAALERAQYHPATERNRQVLVAGKSLKDRVNELALFGHEYWDNDEGLKHISASDNWYQLEVEPQWLGATNLYGILQEVHTPENLVNHEKLLQLHNSEFEIGCSARLTLTPSQVLGDGLPVVSAYILILSAKDSRLVRLVALLWATVPNTNWECDWHTDPITFEKHTDTVSWKHDIEGIAFRFTELAEECIQWGFSFYESQFPLPIAREWWRLCDVEVCQTDRAPLRIAANNKPILSHLDGELTTNRTGHVALRIDAPIVIFPLSDAPTIELHGWPAQGRPALSPDGKRLLFTGNSTASDGTAQRRTGAVWGIDVESGKTTWVYYSGNRGVGRCCWSPNASEIAVTLDEVGRHGATLVILSERGDLVREIYTAEAGKGIWLDFPIWSPDGKYLYFVQSGATPGLWRVDVEAKHGVVRVIEGNLSFPAISWDGSRVAFLSEDEGRPPTNDIIVADVDGMNRHTVGYGNSSLAWTPDSRCLLYVLSDKHHAQYGLWLAVVGAPEARGTNA